MAEPLADKLKAMAEHFNQTDDIGYNLTWRTAQDREGRNFPLALLTIRSRDSAGLDTIESNQEDSHDGELKKWIEDNQLKWCYPDLQPIVLT